MWGIDGVVLIDEISAFMFGHTPVITYFCPPLARVAELVDAADSKSAVRKDVSVRLRSRAQTPSRPGGRFAL